MKTKSIKITSFELFVLNCLARNSYTAANYGMPKNFNDVAGGVWTHSILDADTTDCPEPKKFTKRALPGVVASLVKKGLVHTTNDGKDSTTGLTEKGFGFWSDAFSAPAPKLNVQREIVDAVSAAWYYIEADYMELPGPRPSHKTKVAEAWDRVEFLGYDKKMTPTAKRYFDAAKFEDILLCFKLEKVKL